MRGETTQVPGGAVAVGEHVRAGGAHQAQKLQRGIRAVSQKAVGARLKLGIHDVGEPALHAAHQRVEVNRH